MSSQRIPNYQISKKQQHQLLNKGYIALPSALPGELLARWRNIAEQLENNAMEKYHVGERLHGTCISNDPVGPRLMRYDDILQVAAEAVLDLLACPAMMAIAREFCGCGTVPIQMDILYKHQHPHPVVIWHQGAQHPRNYPYLNVGVYLDDAPAGDGCLRYLPASQHEKKDICALSEKYGWDIPGVIELPAKAGDILIQDMMILHGSQPKRNPGCRRTIYIELRPSASIIEDDAQSPEWVALREHWMAMVLDRADKRDWPADWQQGLPSDKSSVEQLVAAIAARPEPPLPAYYCHYGVETENYPVPADLKSEC